MLRTGVGVRGIAPTRESTIGFGREGGSENQRGNTRVGENGGIHDRGDHTQAGGNGDSANHQVDTPVDRNRNRGSLGRVHVRDDRTETLPDRRKPRRSP